MLREFEYSESTVMSAVLAVAELARHTCEMEIWDQSTHAVKTDMATSGGDNYVNESAADMADHGKTLTTLMLVS